MNTRQDVIKEILKCSPDMKVLWIDQKTEQRWPSEKKLVDLTESEKNQFNLRKQLPNEIILDLEDKFQYDAIKKKLEEKKWSYTNWATGSRGLHLSVLFKDLENHRLELRNRIRKYIINYFQTDVKLAKESQWLAMERTPHFKTGNEKILQEVFNFGEDNKIDEDTLEYCEEDLKKQEQRKIENKEIIKDYSTNDLYLKYILENVIEAGDRNNVLFKNLAIGLVGSGLKRQEILPFAETIVTNCPGKNVGEFMGWVDKALNGSMTEYNKSELVQWSVNNKHPILYKMDTDEKLIDMLTIKQLWNIIWENTIAVQEKWRDLCFYNLMGTVLDERDPDIDLRMHIMFASGSGSGKDMGANLLMNVLGRFGDIKINKPNDITDKTLVGSINQTAIEYNTKWDLNEEEKVKGSRTFKSPIEEGLLATSNWIDFGECENVIKPGNYNRRLQSILRESMDIQRRVEKGVAGKEIKIKTNTSFVMTTFLMNKAVHSVLSNGLFQRMLFYNKQLSKEEHNQICDFDSQKRFGKKIANSFNKEEYIIKLVHRLKEMKKWYYENRFKFEFEDSSADLVTMLRKKAEKDYSDFFEEDSEILDAMFRRAGGTLERLCKLSAISKMKIFISKNTIRECFKMIETCVDSIKDLLLRQDKGTKRMYSVLQIISKSGHTKGTISEMLEKKFKMKNTNKRVEFVRSLIEQGYITTYKVGRSDMLSLTEKGRKYILYEEF